MNSASNKAPAGDARRSARGTRGNTVINIDDVPVSFVVKPLYVKKSDRLVDIETDLVVLDHHTHMYFGGGPKDIDASLDGAISRALSASAFTGALGERVLVALPDKKIKNVLVVGLGEAGLFGRSTFCGFVGLLLDAARELGASKLTIPVFPGRFDKSSLAGSLAVLKCRLAQSAHHPGIGNLKEIEFLSAPQAKRFIVDGLTVTEALCHSCSHPRIKLV